MMISKRTQSANVYQQQRQLPFTLNVICKWGVDFCEALCAHHGSTLSWLYYGTTSLSCFVLPAIKMQVLRLAYN